MWLVSLCALAQTSPDRPHWAPGGLATLPPCHPASPETLRASDKRVEELEPQPIWIRTLDLAHQTPHFSATGVLAPWMLTSERYPVGLCESVPPNRTPLHSVIGR